MNNEGTFGFLLLVLVLGGIILLGRRSITTTSAAPPMEQYHSQGNIRLVPVTEPPHYKNKETRRIEYNDDGLPTLIEITRDYTVA
jgi:hypothetical protein